MGHPQCRSAASCPYTTSSCTTPAPVRICIGRWRRCTACLWLRGENTAMPGGFFLQSLLKSSPRPFTAFGHHFHLNLPQWPRPSCLGFHPRPFVLLVVWVRRGIPDPSIMGAVSRCAPGRGVIKSGCGTFQESRRGCLTMVEILHQHQIAPTRKG